MGKQRKHYGFICESCKRYAVNCKTADQIFNIDKYPFAYSEDPRHDLFQVIFRKCKVKEMEALNG